jgi:hypothetical protein
MAKTPHSLSEISDASTTANVVNHVAHAASGAPFSQGTVVGTGGIVVVDAAALTESALCESEDLLQAVSATRASTNTSWDF